MSPNHKWIYIFHILFVAPLLAYIGYNRGQVNPKIYTILLVLAVIVVLYHGKRLLN